MTNTVFPSGLTAMAAADPPAYRRTHDGAPVAASSAIVTISEPELLVPVTNTRSPAGLTATAEASSMPLPGPLYRLAHSQLPLAAL